MKAWMMMHAHVLAALTSSEHVTRALLQLKVLSWTETKKRQRRKCDLSPVNIKQVKL